MSDQLTQTAEQLNERIIHKIELGLKELGIVANIDTIKLVDLIVAYFERIEGQTFAKTTAALNERHQLALVEIMAAVKRAAEPTGDVFGEIEGIGRIARKALDGE